MYPSVSLLPETPFNPAEVTAELRGAHSFLNYCHMIMPSAGLSALETWRRALSWLLGWACRGLGRVRGWMLLLPTDVVLLRYCKRDY